MSVFFLLIFSIFFMAPPAEATPRHEVRPFFLSGDVNMYLQPVNLTPAKRDGEIIFVDNSAGFYVRSIRALDAAAGVRADFHFESGLPNGSAAIGLFPIYSTYVQFTGYARTESEADNFLYRHVPYEAADVALWREGDTATYDPKGGIAFLAGAGNDFVGLYGKYIVTGGFRVFIERKEGDRVYVEIRSTKSDDISVVFGGLAMNAQLGMKRELSRGFAYEFRLDNPTARTAYEDFLKGHLIPAQELAADYDSGISRHSTVKGKKVKKYTSFYFGTPFISLVALAGASESFYQKDVRLDPWGGSEEVHWGAKVSFRDVIFFNKKRRYVEGFSAQGAAYGDSDGTVVFPSSGEAFYERRSNFGSVSALNEVLEDLLQRTGLDFLRVKMRGEGTVGYSEVRLSLSFQEEFIQHLIAHPEELGRYQDEALRTYELSQQAKEYENFRNQEGGADRENPRDKIMDSFFQMRKLLPEIAEALREGNRKGYVESYAAFGRQMWADPNVFRVIFHESQKCGLSVDFEVSGRKISRYLKRFSWLKKETCTR